MKTVVALLDRHSFDEIDGPVKDRRQLLLHRHPFEEAPRRIRRKPDQHVHVTVVAELLGSRDTAEKRKLRHSPPAAKVAELVLVDRDGELRHGLILRRVRDSRRHAAQSCQGNSPCGGSGGGGGAAAPLGTHSTKYVEEARATIRIKNRMVMLLYAQCNDACSAARHHGANYE